MTGSALAALDVVVTGDSKNGGGPGEVYVRDCAWAEGYRIPLECFFCFSFVKLLKLFFNAISNVFFDPLGIVFGPHVGPMLGAYSSFFPLLR